MRKAENKSNKKINRKTKIKTSLPRRVIGTHTNESTLLSYYISLSTPHSTPLRLILYHNNKTDDLFIAIDIAFRGVPLTLSFIIGSILITISFLLATISLRTIVKRFCLSRQKKRTSMIDEDEKKGESDAEDRGRPM